MGRQRGSSDKKPMTGAERAAKRRKDPAKQAADNLKKRIACATKALENPPTDKQIEERREAARIRKAYSRLQQSQQKKVGTQIKDRNRKRAEAALECDDGSETTSTNRVRIHRDKIKFPFLRKKAKIVDASKALNCSLELLSPKSKVDVLSQTCSSTMSPASRHDLANNIDGNSVIEFTKTIAKKRDKTSNCTRRLAYSHLITKASGNYNKVRKLDRGLKFKSLKNASEKDINDTIKHYKTTKYKSEKEPTETVKRVTEFYNKDSISRQLPYKNLTRRVKDHNGNYHRVPVRVMEVTLKKALDTFKSEYPDVKISTRTFENLRPKYVRLRRYAQRLQCCCTYHTNMDYVRKGINNVFLKNGKEIPFPDNDALISAALCHATSLQCINRICAACKSFPKIDALDIPSLKCSKSCLKEGKDCNEHTILIHQFQRVEYMHKGEQKKKLKLVDQMIKLTDLVTLFKTKMEKFPMHRFSVQNTAKTFDSLVDNLDENSILKIHDFSENYTCLLPEEIQSLHWTQEMATVYPIVVMRKLGDNIREDHLVFISDDKTHDVPFVEKCNEILHDYYAEEGLIITHDIEYNDGCGSQFKCIRAFVSLARRPIKTSRIFTETRHGKSKSDGLGGVVKSYASRAVCGERRVIRNAEELSNFFKETLVVKSAVDSMRPMLNRLFFFLSASDMEIYRDAFPTEKYGYIHGTLSIHQVVTTPGNHDGKIQYRKSSCGCSFCLGGSYKDCLNINLFKECPEMLKMNTHTFKLKGTRQRKKKGKQSDESDDDDYCDLDEDEMNERESEEYFESDASKVIISGDIALIKTGDHHPYYLLKLIKDPYVTEDIVSDDYGHLVPPLHRVVEGHYLEIHKNNNDGDVYYLDESKKAIVSSFAVVGNCPPPEVVSHKRRGKQEDMYFVDHNLHQGLCELVNCFDM